MAELVDHYDAQVARGDLQADAGQRACVERLDALRTSLEETSVKRGFIDRLRGKRPEPPRGVYLWGGVGRGKSMLMDMFFDATDIHRKRRVHFHAFMQEIHDRLDVVRKKGGVEDAILPVADDVAEGARLLCFDEMQISDIADAMIVGRLFERLLAKGVTVVTTSNRAPEDLYRNGLNRKLFLPFIALMRDRLDVTALDGPTDYRLDRLSHRQVWFQPADAAATRAIDVLWTELAGEPGEPMVLEVKGRQVTLNCVHNGVARASFAELCARPLGPRDFLAIADAVRVLMIEDIPVLSRARNNEAKRFVTLIDALYEARVILVGSAAAEPEQLYVDGEGAFEFARTASRLREMQSADWAQSSR